MNVSGSLTAQQAPCGRLVDAERYQDQDEEVVITREVDYACGCRSIQHEYHDGSVAAGLSGTMARSSWTNCSRPNRQRASRRVAWRCDKPARAGSRCERPRCTASAPHDRADTAGRRQPPVTPSHDVVLVGGGGAGLRAAIAIAETNPRLEHRGRLQGLPDAEPHGLRRGRRRGRHRARTTASTSTPTTPSPAATGCAIRTPSRRSSRKRPRSCCGSSTGAARGAASPTAGSPCAPSAA